MFRGWRRPGSLIRAEARPGSEYTTSDSEEG